MSSKPVMFCASAGGVLHTELLTGQSVTVGSVAGTAAMVDGGPDDVIVAVPTPVHIVHSPMLNQFKCAVNTIEDLTVMNVS